MDDFTKKLLERTQARKEQLAMKRMELAACRSKRTAPSPTKPRQPLAENNTDNSPAIARKPTEVPEYKDNTPGKIARDPVVSSSVKVNLKFKESANAVDNKRARILSDPSSPAAKTRQGADVADCKRQRILSDGSAPSSPAASRLRSKADIDTESPSIQARRQRLLEMQKKDGEVTPKKHWKKAVDMNPADNSSPSIAARSAAFIGKQEVHNITPNQKPSPCITTKTPVTSGKLVEARNIFEKGANTNSATKSEGRPAKINLVGPPKPPRTADINTACAEKSATKRKAPAPPGSLSEEEKTAEKSWKNARGSDKEKVKRKPGSERVEGSRKGQEISRKANPGSEEVLIAKARKRVQNGGDTTDGSIEETKQGALEDERAKRREERKKARIEQRDQEKREVIVSKEAAVCRKEKVNEDTAVIMACSVEDSAPRRVNNHESGNVTTVKAVPVTCTVKRVPTFEKKDIPQKSVKVLSIGGVDTAPSRADESQEVCDTILQAAAMEEDMPKEPSRKPTHTASFRAQQEFKVPSAGPFQLQRCERHAHPSDEEESPCELDETVNLNDVNIHEMTFTFDFSNFDKIEEDRETKFQKSFNEKCQELGKDKQTDSKSSNHTSNDISPREEPEATIEKTDMGVYKSGYQDTADDKYATKTLLKARPPIPERPKATHDRLKELLDQAASQQNIVLQMSQALNVCATSQDIFAGSQEEVEAERLLLLAGERKQACLNEHQRLKSRPHESMRGRQRAEIGQPCSATLSVSGIQLSLKQEFMDVLRVGIRQDLGVFHFVIHIQSGPLEITSSKTLSTNDCTEGTTLTFPDKFVLKELDPKFAVYIKVFGMNVQKRTASTLTPNQRQKFFQSPKVAKNKRRGVEGASPGPEALPVFRSTNFKLVGVARVTLPTVNSKKLGLEYIPEGCPLHDYIRVKVRCTPQYKCLVKGFLTILEDIGGYNAWQRRWCVLEGGMLSHWRYPGDETTKPPLGSLDLGKCIGSQVTTVSRDLCARPNTLEVVISKGEENNVKFLLACDTKADKVTWLDSLNEALKDYKAWSTCHKKALYPDLGQIEGSSAPARPEQKPEQKEVSV